MVMGQQNNCKALIGMHSTYSYTYPPFPIEVLTLSPVPSNSVCICIVPICIFQGNPHVWISLSDVTVNLVLEKITSSAMIEGLWLCRRHQLKDQQQVNKTVYAWIWFSSMAVYTSRVVATIIILYKITNVYHNIYTQVSLSKIHASQRLFTFFVHCIIVLDKSRAVLHCCITLCRKNSDYSVCLVPCTSLLHVRMV